MTYGHEAEKDPDRSREKAIDCLSCQNKMILLCSVGLDQGCQAEEDTQRNVGSYYLQ